jgi:hypothetical protein
MIRQDYLLREIERIVEFALRAMGLKQEQPAGDFARFIEEHCNDLTGLEYQTLLASPSAKLVSLLYHPGTLEIGRLIASGTLLCEAADAERLSGNEPRGRELFTRGAEILAFTAAHESGEAGEILAAHLRRLHPRIPQFQFPPEAARRLETLCTPRGPQSEPPA